MSGCCDGVTTRDPAPLRRLAPVMRCVTPQPLAARSSAASYSAPTRPSMATNRRTRSTLSRQLGGGSPSPGGGPRRGVPTPPAMPAMPVPSHPQPQKHRLAPQVASRPGPCESSLPPGRHKPPLHGWPSVAPALSPREASQARATPWPGHGAELKAFSLLRICAVSFLLFGKIGELPTW